jgi:hypothetical protein
MGMLRLRVQMLLLLAARSQQQHEPRPPGFEGFGV